MNTFSGKKIPLFEFVVCLVSTFTATSKKKAIADAHRNFINLSGKNISRSSFWQRLANRKLVDFLEKAVLNFAFQIQQKALCQLSWLSTIRKYFCCYSHNFRFPIWTFWNLWHAFWRTLFVNFFVISMCYLYYKTEFITTKNFFKNYFLWLLSVIWECEIWVHYLSRIQFPDF